MPTSSITPPATPTSQPSWWKSGPTLAPKRQKTTSLQDYFQQFLTNRAIRWMNDPATQATTAQFLARDNPASYGIYSGVPLGPSPSATGASTRQSMSRLTPEYLSTLISQLRPAKVLNALPSEIGKEFGEKSNQAARQEALASGKWLNEYLKTASLAAGTGRKAPTRSQQGYAREHLATLTREAQDMPSKSKYLTLAENLVNPVLGRAPQTGILGRARVTAETPGGDYRRAGVAFRNPFAT